jgi:hypothetical protein
MILFSYEVVLWAPAAKYPNRCHSEGAAVINSDGLLKLVKGGFVKIAARQEYIEGKRFVNREKPWAGGEWEPSFDDRIRASLARMRELMHVSVG